jgi:hypothetical protein
VTARMHHARRHRIEAEDMSGTSVVPVQRAGLGSNATHPGGFRWSRTSHVQPCVAVCLSISNCLVAGSATGAPMQPLCCPTRPPASWCGT